jgi:ketosteroid isomerase-like protein
VSAENVEVVRRMLELSGETLPRLARGENLSDDPSLLLWHPDCVIQELSEVPDAQTYHGREGLIEYFRRLFELFGEIEYHPREFVDAGDHVVATSELWARSRAGAETAMTIHQVYEIREGMIAFVTAFLDRGRALERAGLPAD